MSHELHNGAGDALWQSLRSLDAYRRKFTSTPDTLTNPVLLGTPARAARPGAAAGPRDRRAA